MAIAVISDFPGGTAEQDEARQRQLNVDVANPPKGALARLAGPFEGGWRVISVFESQEAWETFRRDQLDPMFQQAGLPAPRPQIWPLHSVIFMPRQR
jgi:hypothetical protein